MSFSAYTYVAEYYGYQGTEITANLGEAFPYIITQSYPYLCFSIVFYVMGLLLQKLNDLHDYLPREYLHPKELEEQEVEIADDAIGQKVWETPLMEDASTSVEVVDSLDTERRASITKQPICPKGGMSAVLLIPSVIRLSVYDQAFFSK